MNPDDRQDRDVQVKYNVEKLRLRRKRNLAKIMHTQSKNIENLKATSVERNLRIANKIKMKNDFTNITKNTPPLQGNKAIGQSTG